MSTISVAAPVQTATPNTLGAACSSSSPGTAARSDEQQSFANVLKESHSQTDKTEQTTAPGPLTSPKTAPRSEKESRRHKTDETQLAFPGATVVPESVLDARGLLLSWRSASTEATGSKGKVESTGGKAQPAGTSDAVEKLAGQQPGSIAFGVTIANPEVDKESLSEQGGKGSQAIPQAQSAGPGGVAIHATATGPLPEALGKVNANPAAQAKNGHTTVPAAATPGIQKPSADTDNASKDQGQRHEKDQNAEPAANATAAGPVHQHEITAAAAPSVAKAEPGATTSTVPVPTAYHSIQPVQPAASSAPAAPVTQVDAIAEPPATPVFRPHSIDLKVNGAGDSQIDVRVSQRAGDVEVTVRTPDTDLAQSLRQHLPELSDSLSQSGVHGDVWQPAAAQMPADADSQQNAGDTSRWQGNRQDQQQRQQQQEESGSQQQQSNGQAGWLNEFYTAEKEGR